MQIFITGVAGFIGFNLSKYLLRNSKLKVFGVDNLNTYYSKSLKLKRVRELKKFHNFKFKKIDITNKKQLDSFFKGKKISLIINLAAQAGVRYSLKKPTEYVDNNILGFYNIINLANNYKVKKIIYASSSSVYGDSITFPLNEKQKIKPKNIYALSKKINEEMAEVFSEQFKIYFTGLRFFTVYGEWGRPDMFLFKLLKAYKKKNFFYLNNFGNHTRDFTYSGDVVKILNKLVKLKKFNFDIANICNSNPVNIRFICKNFQKKYNFKKIKLVEKNKADVLNTHGDNRKIKKIVKMKKFTPFNVGFKKTSNWYFKKSIYKF